MKTGGSGARRRVVTAAITLLLSAALSVTQRSGEAEARGASCPAGMVLVSQRSLQGDAAPEKPLPDYCVDAYEGSLVFADDGRPFSPYEMIRGRRVKAVSRAGVVPQAYISRNEADAACKASHKRLCIEAEWTTACRGKRPTAFPYGDERKQGYCNDSGVPPLQVLHPGGGPEVYQYDSMTDPRLNAIPGTVARTGRHTHCKSSWGTFDMVGNVHEWIADPAGTFLGGYYLDTHINGDGCSYRTVAHDADYHDYSTGFRCCADLRGQAPRAPARSSSE